MRRLSVLVGICFLLACSGKSSSPIMACESIGVITPICGLQAPEDMALLPDGKHLLLSQYGGMDAGSGSLALLNLDTEKHQIVFPLTNIMDGKRQVSWGDPDCPAMPGVEFSPHGIYLSSRMDGALQLLVVNHGGRESIEFFEIDDKNGSYELNWRGCVLAPEDSFFNDVVAGPDGGLMVTSMFSREHQLSELLLAILGFDTGEVWHWQKENGFRIIDGSQGPFPNGIEISADGRFIFINVYMANEVRKVDWNSGELLGVAKVKNPDNSSWSKDGLLLVASHTGSMFAALECSLSTDGPCSLAFEIVAVEPKSMAEKTLFQHQGAPMGGATVALDHNKHLYIGSYVGDRLIKVDMKSR